MRFKYVKLIFLSILICTLNNPGAVPAELNKKEDSLGIFRDCDFCSVMINLPSGSYLMGANKKEFEIDGNQSYRYESIIEGPQHVVKIDTFSMSKFDVTKSQFEKFVLETNFTGEGCEIIRQNDIGSGLHFNKNSNWNNVGFIQTDNDPVVCVSWDDAQKYIAWVNKKIENSTKRHYRLPTEEEWEYAARSGSTGTTYWNGIIADQCKFANAADISLRNQYPQATLVAPCNDGYRTTSPVGSFHPNQWGLFDMLGNVFQWTSTCYRFNYSNLEKSSEAFNNSCEEKAVRGSSWFSIPAYVRSANRTSRPHDYRNSLTGFRLVADQ